MSNSPEPGRDPRPASWASPGTTDGHDTQRFDEAPASGSTRVDHAVDVTPDTAPQQAPQQAPDQGRDQSPYQAAYQAPPPPPPATDQPFPADAPDSPPQPQPYGAAPGAPWGPIPPPVPPQRTQRRGPGWTGVVAVGAGAALLSSLLTIGIAENRLDSSSASQTTTSSSGNGNSSSAQSSAPLVTDGAPAPDWVAVAQAVEPSVVSVRVGGAGDGGEGSGIVYDNKGHVLTNHHVVAAAVGGNGRVSVVLSDGRAYTATVVGSDPSTDLAILQVRNAPSDMKPASFADSDAVKVGDPVMAAGNPLGLSDTVTTGIVSALDRPVRTQQQSRSGDPSDAQQVVTNAIQTDAAVNPGNSGGALVDANGRVIGVTSSIASLRSAGGQAGNIGLGFAIPSNEARDVADQLLQSGSVKHAFLGVTLRDGSVELEGAQRQAAVVAEVTSDSAADKAGLRNGDPVVAVDGKPLEGADSLVATIRALRPGTTVTLTVVRDGAKSDVKVTLGTRPANNN